MAKKTEKLMEISIDAKNRLKDIYKEIIVDEISEELKKQRRDAMIAVEDSLKENNLNVEGDKKSDKIMLAKLEEILIRMDMLESKEERELQVLANNVKILMISNSVLLVILILAIIF